MIRLALAAPLLTTQSAAAQSLCICLKCTAGGFRHYVAQSESMSPTLPPGTCFTAATRGPAAPAPDAGQIVTFTADADGVTYAFRVVALPGQTVQMQAGTLFTDGAPVDRRRSEDFLQIFQRGPTDAFPLCPTPVDEGASCTIARYVETLPNRASYETLDLGLHENIDTTAIFTVLDGHVFVMGDHRDASSDSRFLVQADCRSFVPIANITGTFDAILRP